MKLGVFAVRDVKAEAFGALICSGTKGLATRSFLDVCQDPKSPMAQYPQDYSLYQVGEYDRRAGTLVAWPLPELVVTATEVLAQARKDREAAEPILPGVAA